MTVRKFRGPDLSAALRKVKRELGEDAVIVSTKEVIEGGVMGFFGKAAVEVVTCSQGTDPEAGCGDRARELNLTLPREVPPPGTGSGEVPAGRHPAVGGAAGSYLRGAGLEREGQAAGIVTGVGAGPGAREFKPLVLGEEPPDVELPGRMVFIGLSGTGKTTCAGRMAWALARDSDVLVVSIEEEGRLSGAVRWREVWSAMGVRFEAVMGADRAAALAEGHDGPVLVDTPPLVPGADLELALRGFGALTGFGVCLVVDSHLDEREITRLLDMLDPVKPDVVMLTKTDELLDRDKADGLAGAIRGCLVYTCDSPLVTCPPAPRKRPEAGKLIFG